MNIWCIL